MGIGYIPHTSGRSRGCHKDTHLFFFYYGIHSLMFGGYPPTAIGYPPTAIGYTPTAIGYPPTAIGYTPTAIGYPPTAIGYTPTAIGYPPTAIVGRIGHSEFFFFHYGTPWAEGVDVWLSLSPQDVYQIVLLCFPCLACQTMLSALPSPLHWS